MNASDLPLKGGNFQLFVQRLGYQALINLGVLENPITREKTINLEHAEAVLQDLNMIADKTRGNLAEEEEEHLTRVLDQLKGRFQELAES